MKKIINSLETYFKNLDQRIFWLSFGFISLAVFVNYYFGLNHRISILDEPMQYLAWYVVFLAAFSFTYFSYALFGKKNHFADGRFLFLLLTAPAIFSWKMAHDTDFGITEDPVQNAYWNQVIYWPFKLLVIITVLFIIWKSEKEKGSFYGLSFKNFQARPYLIMLLIMIPLVTAASTQPDFLNMYPKLKNISFLSGRNNGLYKLLYEVSYGIDFISIELFFRGFLVLAFARWFGKDAILPMALFYCTIHFGKPLGECISSFFGGLVLGVVTYHTRTILGGLMVHVGIAWMMELGGYLGNYFR